MHEERVPIPNEGKDGIGKTAVMTFDSKKCIDWYMQRKAAGSSGDNDYIDPVYEKARLDRERANEVSMRNALKNQEIAEVGLIQDVLQSVAEQIASIFDALESKLKLHTGLEQREIDVLMTEVADARAAISDIQYDFKTPPEADKPVDTDGSISSKDQPADDGGRVG